MATSQAPSKLEATCNLPSETLVVIISGILNDISDLSTSRGVSTRFHSRELLPISIQDYLGRIVKWLPASDDALLLMLLYLRRVALQLGSPLPPRYKPSRHARPVINHWTVHRLVLISLSLASKVGDCDRCRPPYIMTTDASTTNSSSVITASVRNDWSK